MSGTIGLDPNIYAQAGKPAVPLQTPIQAMGTVLPVANQLIALRGKMAVGNALQQATDPTTGNVDLRTFNRLIASDPQAVGSMQEAANQSQALTASQQNVANSRNQQISSLLGSVLALPDGQLHDGAAAALGRAATMGLAPQAQLNQLAMRLPNDPQGLRSTLQQMRFSLMSPSEQQEQTSGAPAQLDNGQSIISGVRAPAWQGGGFTSATATPTYPSRAQLLNQEPGVDPQGRPTATPLVNRAQQQGAGALTGPAGASMQPPGLPPGLLPQGYTGRYAPAQSSPPAPPGGAVTTGLAPGQAESQAATAVAGAQQGIALQTAADQSSTRLGMLGNMLGDLNNFTPGPGNTRETYAQSLLQRYAPGVASTFNLDPQRVASAESFSKLANQIAMQQAGTLGAGTDEKLLTAMHANPNADLSKLGNQQIIGMLQGNEDAIQAKNRAWQAWQQQHGAGTYGQFSTNFNQNFDPRVFQFMRLSRPDRVTMARAMQPDEQKQFQQSFQAARSSGLLPVQTP